MSVLANDNISALSGKISLQDEIGNAGSNLGNVFVISESSRSVDGSAYKISVGQTKFTTPN